MADHRDNFSVRVKLSVLCCNEKYTLHAVCCGDNVAVGDHAGAADMTPTVEKPPATHATL